MSTSKQLYSGSAEETHIDSPEDFQKRLCTMEYETQFYGFSPLAYYDFRKSLFTFIHSYTYLNSLLACVKLKLDHFFIICICSLLSQEVHFESNQK